MTDTIFALSSGALPAAIAVIRITGPRAGEVLAVVAGRLPPPRRASLRTLRNADGGLLDEALVLWLPGPHTATGEDCAELHCHGGRAVVAAVFRALNELPEVRAAEAGEFTRRAFANGRIDLAQAEALGDLLAAETEWQRRAALAGVGGGLSEQVEKWRGELLALSAAVEAVLDFADEDDVARLDESFGARIEALCAEIAGKLALPRGERLRDGFRTVLAGPPNSGKSSLFNALLGEGAAIVTATPGTTRDVLERPVAFDGIPFVLVDTAGLRDDAADTIEAIGIARARDRIVGADIVLWLGKEGQGPAHGIEVQPRCDDPHAPKKCAPDYVVSSVTGEGLSNLVDGLAGRARKLLPRPDQAVLNARQAQLLDEAVKAIGAMDDDPLLAAEALRTARVAFDRLLGTAGVEDMLDALFARFCIGK